MSNNLPKKILIVDNDIGAINNVEQLLRPYNINILKASDWGSAIYQFNQNRFDLCIVAIRLEEVPGTVLIQKWRAHDTPDKRDTAFIVARSNQSTPAEDSLLVEIGDVVHITKPYKLASLLSAMAQAMNLKANRVAINALVEATIIPQLEAGEYDKAVTISKAKLEPTGENGKFRSALIHEEAKHIENALALLTTLAADHPKNMKYTNEIGRIHMQQGNLEEARKAYQRADEVAPLNLKRVNELAYMYLKTQDPERSIEKFKELIKLNPETPDLKFDAYTAIFEAGFAEHAQQFCRETSTPKELVRHFNNKGVLLAKETLYDEAIAEYKRAADLIPGHKELYRILYNMALSHINKKTRQDIELAHNLLKESLKLQPDYDKAQEKLEITSKHLGKNGD